MVELPLAYMNELADRIIFISALLGGFSLAVIVTFLGHQETTRFSQPIFRAAAISTASFLVTIFSMTKILMLTTPGFPYPIASQVLMLPRILGTLAFFVGIISLLVIVALSGWAKSATMGRFTSVLGIVSMIIVLMMLF